LVGKGGSKTANKEPGIRGKLLDDQSQQKEVGKGNGAGRWGLLKATNLGVGMTQRERNSFSGAKGREQTRL